MKIPLLDLRAQYASIKNDVLAAVGEVLDSQVCIGGPKIAELEQKVAALSDCRYAVAVSSGTDAILCSLMSLDIGPGDEVITTPYTFFATAGCISRVGATPVFVDINPRSYNIDPSLIEKAVTARTKAIMPVHLFGQMADMDPIMEVANRHGLFVIEDAAQAISATYKGRRAGSIGTAGCFSFFPSKNLGAAGDGGMIVSNSASFYERASVMRNHGAKPKYYHTWIGGNFRLDAIQAAILLVKLRHLDEWSELRRQHASRYSSLLSHPLITIPYVAPENTSIYNQYVIRVPQRDELLRHLAAAGIGSEVYYPLPLHLQRCFQYLGYAEASLPESEAAAKETMALPVYPELTREMEDYVIESILAFVTAAEKKQSSSRTYTTV